MLPAKALISMFIEYFSEIPALVLIGCPLSIQIQQMRFKLCFCSQIMPEGFIEVYAEDKKCMKEIRSLNPSTNHTHVNVEVKMVTKDLICVERGGL